MGGREFFTALSVSEALAGFRPSRRTGVETVPREEALGRVPASPVVSGSALPGFARSTVDGYAVRAADTYGAGDGLPAYLDVIGQVRMGSVPDTTLRPGAAVQIPTGAAIPEGADAVVMVEHTQATMPGAVEVTRPVAVGDGIVRADEDVAVGAVIAPAGRPLRAQDLGLLAAAGVTAARGPRPAAGGDRVHGGRGGASGHPGPGRRAGARRHRVRAGRPGDARPAASRRTTASCPTTSSS